MYIESRHTDTRMQSTPQNRWFWMGNVTSQFLLRLYFHSARLASPSFTNSHSFPVNFCSLPSSPTLYLLHWFLCDEIDSYSSPSRSLCFPDPPLFPFFTCFISVPLSHLISNANTPSNRRHHSMYLCECVRVCISVCVRKRLCLGRGDEFPPLIPFLRLRPCFPSRRGENPMEMQSQSFRVQTRTDTHAHACRRAHTHDHAQTHTLLQYRKGAMQKIVLDMVMRRGGSGCGEGGTF